MTNAGKRTAELQSHRVHCTADKNSVSPCNPKPTATFLRSHSPSRQHSKNFQTSHGSTLQSHSSHHKSSGWPHTTSDTQPLSAPRDGKDLYRDVP